MKRVLIALVLALASLANAHAADRSSICTHALPPDCVVPNWGQIGPDGTDDVAFRSDDIGGVATRMSARMAVQIMPTALPSAVRRPLRAVVSPRNLFPRETSALTTAIRRARFDTDGAIVNGAEAIERAAVAAIRRAGEKYALTLYVKIPERLPDDENALLTRKVRAVNDVLARASTRDPNGKPAT